MIEVIKIIKFIADVVWSMAIISLAILVIRWANNQYKNIK